MCLFTLSQQIVLLNGAFHKMQISSMHVYRIIQGGIYKHGYSNKPNYFEKVMLY